MSVLERMELSELDPAWLERNVQTPEDFFARQLQSGPATRHEWVRHGIETNRDIVESEYQDGDELWYWRFRIDGGIPGIHGLALKRSGSVIQVWGYPERIC